jgi:hypothetical protein
VLRVSIVSIGAVMYWIGVLRVSIVSIGAVMYCIGVLRVSIVSIERSCTVLVC